MLRGGFVPGCAMCAQGFCMEHYHVDPVISCTSVSPPLRGAALPARVCDFHFMDEAAEVPSETWEHM